MYLCEVTVQNKFTKKYNYHEKKKLLKKSFLSELRNNFRSHQFNQFSKQIFIFVTGTWYHFLEAFSVQLAQLKI